MKRKTISIDFDGVIHDYSAGWTGYLPTGEPITGAREFILEQLAEGTEVVISSCRAYTQLGRLGIRDWLEQHSFPVVHLVITCEKPHADVYIDDRGLRFSGCFQAVRERLNQPVWFTKLANPELEV